MSRIGIRFLLFAALTDLPSFFYQQQWVHFSACKMIKAMQIGLKLCRRWRAEPDRSPITSGVERFNIELVRSSRGRGVFSPFICWLKRADDSPGPRGRPIS